MPATKSTCKTTSSPKIVQLLPEPAPLRMRASFNERGQWTSGEVFNIRTQKPVTIPRETLRLLESPQLKNTTCDVTFSRDEVHWADPRTRMAEMAPMPPRDK